MAERGRRAGSYTGYKRAIMLQVPRDDWFTQRAAGGYPAVLRRLVRDGLLEIRIQQPNDLCRQRVHREYRMTDAGRDYLRSIGCP
jgi:DNA-binding PadR family transcriptional regulator